MATLAEEYARKEIAKSQDEILLLEERIVSRMRLSNEEKERVEAEMSRLEKEIARLEREKLPIKERIDDLEKIIIPFLERMIKPGIAWSYQVREELYKTLGSAWRDRIDKLIKVSIISGAYIPTIITTTVDGTVIAGEITKTKLGNARSELSGLKDKLNRIIAMIELYKRKIRDLTSQRYTIMAGTEVYIEENRIKISRLKEKIAKLQAGELPPEVQAMIRAELEADRARLEASRSSAEADRSAAEADKSEADAGAAESQAERAEGNAEWAETEAERAKAEADRARAEAEAATAEEKARLLAIAVAKEEEARAAKTEAHVLTVEAQAVRAEADRAKLIAEAKVETARQEAAEAAAKIAEQEKKIRVAEALGARVPLLGLEAEGLLLPALLVGGYLMLKKPKKALPARRK